MQIEADVVKCMQTNFGGRGLSGFRDTATFKFGQISLEEYIKIEKKICNLMV